MINHLPETVIFQDFFKTHVSTVNCFYKIISPTVSVYKPALNMPIILQCTTPNYPLRYPTSEPHYDSEEEVHQPRNLLSGG